MTMGYCGSPTAASSGLAITGEIDEATYPALVTSLHELAEGHEVVQLDLSGVSYCDLAGLRAIVRLAVTRARAPRAVSCCSTCRSTSGWSWPSPAGTRSRD